MANHSLIKNLGFGKFRQTREICRWINFRMRDTISKKSPNSIDYLSCSDQKRRERRAIWIENPASSP